MSVDSSYSPQLIKRIFASGAIGNILETYDLILISLMATTLGKVFFPPSENPYAHVIDILYILLIGLLVRPIGNIIMSTFADQIGRKKLMIISLIFTGLGTILIGLLPSYTAIGIWSTILFIALRVLQNFFAGIEYINSATYLIESSNKNTLGYFGSWTAIGISGGYLVASLIVLIFTQLISHNFLPEWSWRFIFLLSFIGIIFGLRIRNSIPESLSFILNNASTNITKKTKILQESSYFIKKNLLHCLAICGLTLMGTYLSFIYYIFIPIQLVTTRSFSKNIVLSLNVISLILIVLLIPIFGKLSDYYKRTNLLKVTCFFIIFLAVPFFWVTSYGNFQEILVLTLLISIPSACFFAIYPVIITNSFPSKIRCTTASLIYQIVVSIEMGMLPLTVHFLIKKTHIPYSPGYLLIISTLIGLSSIFILKKDPSSLHS